jgi:hypothetical protein
MSIQRLRSATARAVVPRLLIALLIAGVGAGVFFAGRQSAERRVSVARGGFEAGYLAGHEDAFSEYDGGWAYGTAYIVTLRRGGPGITYRFARRWPMMPGFDYSICGRLVCSHPAH